MRHLILGALLLLAAGLAGCGASASDDPNKLVPLTDKDKAEIQKRDQQVQEEEGGNSFGKVEKKARR